MSLHKVKLGLFAVGHLIKQYVSLIVSMVFDTQS